jgi:hypothetical protein
MLNSLLHQMSIPDIPLDVIITVAEFLAGDHAFGTLGALNQLNHEIKIGTMPVLYETLFFDKLDQTDFYRPEEVDDRSATPSDGFHYTKSVLFHSEKAKAEFADA